MRNIEHMQIEYRPRSDLWHAVSTLVVAISLPALVLCPLRPMLAQTNVSPAVQSKPAMATIRAAEWERLLPEVRRVVRDGGFDEIVDMSETPTLVQTGFITGDGVRVALIDLGGVGASTDGLTLIRVEHGKPVLARFRERNGTLVDGELFIQGSSVMHSRLVELLPAQRAVYTIAIAGDSEVGQVDTCEVELYQWVPRTRTFAWNLKLTREFQRRLCKAEHNATAY
jgi:hypothetical protein